MDSRLFTQFHVGLSLVAIGAGFIVLYGLLTANQWKNVTNVFLATTAATSVTGFFFHRAHILPSHVVGVVSLAVLAATMLALYAHQLHGWWRVVYILGATLSLYLNVFVLVAQAFLKVGSLHALAPTGTEPPFAVTQGVVLLMFAVISLMATLRFRPLATSKLSVGPGSASGT